MFQLLVHFIYDGINMRINFVGQGASRNCDLKASAVCCKMFPYILISCSDFLISSMSNSLLSLTHSCRPLLKYLY